MTPTAEDEFAQEGTLIESNTLTSATASTGHDTEKGRSAPTFVEYAPPPPPPVPPPAKYKLSLIIWFLVYFVSWFAFEADIAGALVRGGLRFYMAQFVVFLIEITVMVYFGMEPLIGLSRVKIGGTWYGLLPWLKQPRCQWVHKYDNVFIEFLAVVIKIAEDGFEIFNPPSTAKPQLPPKHFDLSDKAVEVVLRLEHPVQPDKVDEYEVWVAKISKYTKEQPGFVSLEKVDRHEGQDDDLRCWNLTWESVDDLNHYMTSPLKVEMVKELQPMLNSPSVAKFRNDRHQPGAFADILARQGEAAPLLPPKKWKVWWTTACGLFFAFLITQNTLMAYFPQWGFVPVKDVPFPAVNVVTVFFLVFVLSYLVNPFINLLVSQWLARQENENDTMEPWKTLNDGLPPPIQLLGLIAYFGATGAIWANK